MENKKSSTLCEKHRPKCFVDIKGQENSIDMLKAFFRKFPMKKAVILQGPAGTGKTSLAYALAKENNLEIFELNASDLRNRDQLERVLKPASEQSSLFNKGKIILMDEVDGLSATDRGGLPELLYLIEKTQFPMILTSNNIWQQKFNLLRQKAEIVQLKELNYKIITDLLDVIAKKENINIDRGLLVAIAVRSKGDMRAALNDLQAAANTGELAEAGESERDKEEDIFNILRTVFKAAKAESVLDIYDKTEMSIDDIFLWVEENIPAEYSGEALARAFDALSIADVFRGRIYRQQHWRFLIYENILLSVGISSAKKVPKQGFTKYSRPQRVLKIWLHNQKNATKKSIAIKYAKALHMSKKRAMRDFFMLPLIIGEQAKKRLDLDEQESAFLDDTRKLELDRLKVKNE